MTLQSSTIGSYAFRKKILLDAALCHPSTESPVAAMFQRLEFMGDSVLHLVITEALMQAFPQESEGDLSKRRDALVSRDTCDAVGTVLDLHRRIKVGARVDMYNSSIVADAVEAVIGAIYLDSDNNIDSCRKWILECWKPFMEQSRQRIVPPVDPKSKLQEWTQKRRLSIPVYCETCRSGPDHNLLISISVHIPGVPVAPSTGLGRTKKAAEKQAAAAMLEALKEMQNYY